MKTKIKANTMYALQNIREALQQEAMRAGRYGDGTRFFCWEEYTQRDKSKAFRCVAYNRLVRQISALDNAIEFISEHEKALIEEHNRKLGARYER